MTGPLRSHGPGWIARVSEVHPRGCPNPIPPPKIKASSTATQASRRRLPPFSLPSSSSASSTPRQGTAERAPRTGARTRPSATCASETRERGAETRQPADRRAERLEPTTACANEACGASTAGHGRRETAHPASTRTFSAPLRPACSSASSTRVSGYRASTSGRGSTAPLWSAAIARGMWPHREPTILIS